MTNLTNLQKYKIFILIAAKLFPHKNCIASCKRLTYLGEMLSPTVQDTNPPVTPDPWVGQVVVVVLVVMAGVTISRGGTDHITVKNM